MNNIKEIFNKNNSKLQIFILYVPFIVLFFIFLFIHLRYNYHVDDVFYRQSMLRDGWVEIVGTVYRRYFTWTSRSLIELNIFFLSYVPMIVWKVLDSLILVFMAMIIPKFFLEKNNVKNNILSSLLILLFFIPVYDAMNAGAIAISLNYIWPLFFIIVHFWLLKKYILKNNKLKLLATFLVYILLIFSLLFGCNHEQGLISCLIIYLTLLAYSYYSSKKIDRTLIFMLFLIFISGLFIFLCPGNYQRLIVETNMWWPTFNSLNLFNKLNMGISSFYRLFISGNTIICLLFFLSFGAYNYIISKKDKIIGLITTIPFIIAIIINFILLFGFIPKLNNFFNSPASYNLVSTPLSLFFSFLYLIMTLSILYGIFNILKIKGRKTAFLILLLLSIGFITSIITGFTPTMFISMSRMLIFLYACLYIITYYMITQIIHSQDKSQFYKSKF